VSYTPHTQHHTLTCTGPPVHLPRSVVKTLVCIHAGPLQRATRAGAADAATAQGEDLTNDRTVAAAGCPRDSLP
jgi:hypothetical protein